MEVLSEDEKGKLMLLKEAKIFQGIKSEHIIKFKISYKAMFGEETCCHIGRLYARGCIIHLDELGQTSVVPLVIRL